MKKRFLSFLLALGMVLTLLPATVLADSTYKYPMHAVLTEPVDGQKPSTAATDTGNKKSESNPKITPPIVITKVEWSGELDANGCFKAGVAYTVTVTEQINPECSSRFIFKSEATVNGKKANVISLSEDARTLVASYTFPTLRSAAQIAQDEADKAAEQQAKQDAKDQKEHEAELERRWSQAEADANYPLGDPITLVVNESSLDMVSIEAMMETYNKGSMGTDIFSHAMADYHTLDGRVIRPADFPKISSTSGTKFPLYQVTRVVYDFYFPGDYSMARFPNAQEIWLSPKCDIQGILDNIAREVYDAGSDRRSFYTYNHVLFIPESAYPNGPTYNTRDIPGCRVMLYSGDDVYAAAKKGASAARDWCTNHTYTAEIFTPDRLYSFGTCNSHTLFYYSCSKCGKCEYNPNHLCVYTPLYLLNDGKKLTLDTPAEYACDYEAHIVSDEHFLGINAQGDRVYLTSCTYCGRDRRQAALAETNPAVLASNKKGWAVGGAAYEEALKATRTKDSLRGFVVASDKFVTAKTSGWAKQDVQTAASDNLVDMALLGTDYTKTITRLQFCAVAVKMTEQMLGKSITPAPADSFTDTSNEYVLKAVTAGIAGGVGDGKFDPNGTLTRQQMAAFLYRALMYVKANSDTEYTVYTSKLGSYTDAGQLQSWAKDAMDFMNGLGLISGTSATALSPNNPCTIEQALIVADRSLDAGGIGWYQLVKIPTTNGFVDLAYGDRVWLTASDGTHINKYGREGQYNLGSSFYAIKDR